MATTVESPPTQSLDDIHSTVHIPQKSGWRRFLAFSGPAFLVSVGYMDPGNWGTDIEAGSKFGYKLLWVLVMSNAMAILLQTLTARLGVVTGRDLAQACRENYPRPVAFALWILCEIAIAACDLAEVIGTVIGLKLLFGIPYLWGLAIAAGDTFMLLALQRRGIRLLELVTLLLIAVIAGSFCIEIFLSRPVWLDVVKGFVPALDGAKLNESLYVAIGMLGATVMPHNLYLHSALVQTRAFPKDIEGKRQACKYNLIDSILALNGAFFVNASILVLSVATFYVHNQEVETLQDAHELLGAVWGTTLASILFAIALLASGQSSTLTGTLAGQVVMEGFVRLRLRPWVRRLLTRSLAIVPALVVIALAGNHGDQHEVDMNLLELLVLSQVILSFQLPFAIVPLVLFTSDRRQMGPFANGAWLKVLAWTCAGIVVGLNVVLIYLQMGKWAKGIAEDGGNPLWIYGTLGPLAVVLMLFLGLVAVYPIWRRREVAATRVPPPPLPLVRYQNIGVAVEFAGADGMVLAQAVALARLHGARLQVIHVVEGTGASLFGPETDDQESRKDRERMAELAEHLRGQGLAASGILGYGDPPSQLVKIAEDTGLDLLVLGTHGHRFLADLALGQTVSPVLHTLKIPVLVVPTRAERGQAGG